MKTINKILIIGAVVLCGVSAVVVGSVLGSNSTPTSDSTGSGTSEHQHALTHIEAVAATCTEAGNIEYWTCEECSSFFADEEATDSIAIENTVVPAKGHTEVDDAAVAATCTEAGKTAGKHCSVCNTVTVAQEVVPAKGHQIADEYSLVSYSVENGTAVVAKYCINDCDHYENEMTVEAPKTYNYTISNMEELLQHFTVEEISGHTFVFEGNKLTNTNSQVGSSSAYLNLIAISDGTFNFDVSACYEKGWDYYIIRIDGKEVFNSKPENKEHQKSFSFELKAGQKIQFNKTADSGGWGTDSNGRSDYLDIFNMSYSSSIIPASAEVAVVNFVTGNEVVVNPIVVYKNQAIGTIQAAPNSNDSYFDYWCVDSSLQTPVVNTLVVTNDVTIYAKWVAKSEAYEFFGTYNGKEVYGSNSVSGEYSVTIDFVGNISGTKTGVVSNYDPDTGVITYVDASNNTRYMVYNRVAGVIAIPYTNKEGIVNLGTDFYILAKDATVDVAVKASAFYKDFENDKNYKLRLIEMTWAGQVVTLFEADDQLYANVTYTSLTVENIDVAQANKIADIVIKAEDGTVLLARGYKDGNQCYLDAAYGLYTNGENVLKIGGLGALTENGVEGTYTINESGVVCAYVGNEYLEYTLSGANYTKVKPTITINFVTGEGHSAVESVQANINVAYNLPVLEESGYVFNGWYTEATFENLVLDNSYLPQGTESVTLYAKFSQPAVLTLNYNNGTEQANITYSVNDIPNIENPVYAKHMFEGWYTTSTFEVGTEWDPTVAITEDIEVFAKWAVAPAYNNTYAPTELTGEEANGSTTSVYTRTTSIVNVDPYGKAPKATGYPFSSGDVEIKNYNAETGYLDFYVGTSFYKGYLDAETGIIVITYSKGASAEFNKVMLLSPFETASIVSKVSSSYWNSGYSRAIQYTFEETTYSIFVHNNNVYFNVSFKNGNGEDVIGKECYTSSLLFVYDANNNKIAEFGHDGTTLVELDGLQGTYTNEANTLVLNGVDVATLNGVEGTYFVAEDASHDIDLYVENTYYEVTLGENNTYTINKPMVDIVYDYNYDSLTAAVNVNKNIELALKADMVREGYVFRGWMTSVDGEVVSKYIPTESATLYAKWDVEIIVTVVVGNGQEQQTLTIGSGDIPEITIVEFANGKVFMGWYTTPECTDGTQYNGTEIIEATTLYAKWVEACAQFGEYKGTEVWGASNDGSIYGGTSNKSLSVTTTGQVSGAVSGTITSYEPETGRVVITNNNGNLYFGLYDEINQIFVINYSSRTAGSEFAMSNDIYILAKGKTSFLTAAADSCQWDSGCSRLSSFTINGDSSNKVLVLVYQNALYYNVTYTSASGEVSVRNVYSANVTFFDSEGNEIATING